MFNDSPTPAEIDWACLPAGSDSIPDLELFIFAVSVMNYDALEFDWRAFDMDLQRAEPTVAPPDFNPVMIVVSIDVGFA